MRLDPGAWEACVPPTPGTARKREESRAHGYNKSKGEVEAGEITNFPSLGTGTCQAAAWGTHSLPTFLLPLLPAPRSLLKLRHLTYPEPPPQPCSLMSGARHPRLGNLGPNFLLRGLEIPRLGVSPWRVDARLHRKGHEMGGRPRTSWNKVRMEHPENCEPNSWTHMPDLSFG